VTHKEN